MSGDLISRSRLLEILNYNKAIHEDENGETRQLIAIDINKMIEYVEKMPTAYDVDKVVEQLRYPDNFTIVCGRRYTTVDRAVDIVKAGGVK